MKRSLILVVIMLMLMPLLGMAFGEEHQTGPVSEQSSSQHFSRVHPAPPAAPALRFLMDCMTTNVVAELTGLPQETVKMLLISSPPAVILDAYGVPFEDFTAAMAKQELKLVNQAVSGGLVSKKQGEDIQKRMNRKPPRPQGE